MLDLERCDRGGWDLVPRHASVHVKPRNKAVCVCSVCVRACVCNVPRFVHFQYAVRMDKRVYSAIITCHTHVYTVHVLYIHGYDRLCMYIVSMYSICL